MGKATEVKMSFKQILLNLRRGTCGGDSGGPGTVQISGRRVQVGVVSYGAAAGCELGYPDVFTRVGFYLVRSRDLKIFEIESKIKFYKLSLELDRSKLGRRYQLKLSSINFR